VDAYVSYRDVSCEKFVTCENRNTPEMDGTQDGSIG
jgi:hypothetical protein